MKWNNILFTTGILILFLTVDCYSQIRIQYKSPVIYARENSGELPTYRGEFDDKGWLIIDIENSKVSMVSDTQNQRTFTFQTINYEPTSGHYLAFGKGTMFTYMPNERVFNLMYKRNHIYVFELTYSQNSTVRSEMENL